jgi:hypothetical protein
VKRSMRHPSYPLRERLRVEAEAAALQAFFQDHAHEEAASSSAQPEVVVACPP